MIGSIDVQTGFGAGDDDFDFGPGAGFEIGVGLVDTGILFAEALPGKFGVGDVLDGVIAAKLVVTPVYLPDTPRL